MKTWCTAISTKSPLRGPVSSRTNPLQKGECMRACLRVWVCAREGACVSARAWLVDVPATPACALAFVAAARHARRAQASGGQGDIAAGAARISPRPPVASARAHPAPKRARYLIYQPDSTMYQNFSCQRASLVLEGCASENSDGKAHTASRSC